MTITEYRDKHFKDMKPETLAAGVYLETQGLIFGHDFSTGEAISLAAAFMTRKYDEDETEVALDKKARFLGIGK
jgi:hypothetical protein